MTRGRERERLDVDIAIIGAGPAGLAAAIRLGRRLADAGVDMSAENAPLVLLVEKGAQVGAHLRSGAVLDPRAFQELIPDFDGQAPIELKVSHDEFYYLTRRRAFKVPGFFLPPEVKNEGNVIVSISKLARWMAEQAEAMGIMILPETSVVQPIIDKDKLLGVVTGPKGLDKNGEPKSNYEPGTEIYARLVILAEGALGTVAETVIDHFNLRKDRQPMIYSSAVKEVIELTEKSYTPGKVMVTMGWPNPEGAFGGAFFYDMKDRYVSVGLVYSTDWVDPDVDLHLELQRWKTHPHIHRLLEGGKVVQFSSCIIPETGFWGIPSLTAPGVLLTGDSAGLVNVPRNKGIHLAVKSGIEAAETAFACLQADRWEPEDLATYETRLKDSWAWQELRRVRNMRQAFQDGLVVGALRSAFYPLTGGRLLRDPLPVRSGHRLAHHGSLEPPDPVAFDNVLLVDKPTAVSRGAPSYDEQPSHISIVDTDLCVQCQKRYDSPCTKFCPAFVYRWETDESRIIISHENCLHPKICLVACPFDNILWKPPQGGDGPRFTMT